MGYRFAPKLSSLWFDGQFENYFALQLKSLISGRVHEALSEGTEEEACPGTEAAAEELETEGDSYQETVQRHLQDTN